MTKNGAGRQGRTKEASNQSEQGQRALNGVVASSSLPGVLRPRRYALCSKTLANSFLSQLVMILVGLLRHNITILMSSTPKVDAKGVREAYVVGS